MRDRVSFLSETHHTIYANPVTALLGPRQCGKTTLAHAIAARAEFFDLEDPVSLSRLVEPMHALASLRGLVVIDEVQRRPDLFPVLRVLADRKPLPARFLLLGSASPELLRQGSESLAGRIGFVELTGFTVEEVPAARLRRWWLRGGFPRSFLARSDADSFAWREAFVRTFLERDLRELGTQVPTQVLRRLWMMLAHYHGGIWNASEIAASLGESHPSVKRHLDLLTGALVIRQLPPWFANVGKRQVKSPKVYVRDAGLLHYLLGIPTWRTLEGHPKLGASWEGLVVEEAVRIAGSRNVYFWASHAGAEIDVLIPRAKGNIGIEAKYADAPAVTKSMRIAIEDLKLAKILIVHPGDKTYDLDPKIRVIPLARLQHELTGKKRRPKK
jgi:predicted AAA+ superfamily ATPase